MEIGQRLREERERLGYTQEEFAAIGGSSKASQSSWEAGQAFPNARFLAAISEIGADVGYIVTGVRTPKPAAAIAEGGAEYRSVSKREARILDLLSDLPDEQVRQVQDAAEKEKQLKELREELAEARRKA